MPKKSYRQVKKTPIYDKLNRIVKLRFWSKTNGINVSQKHLNELGWGKNEFLLTTLDPNTQSLTIRKAKPDEYYLVSEPKKDLIVEVDE